MDNEPTPAIYDAERSARFRHLVEQKLPAALKLPQGEHDDDNDLFANKMLRLYLDHHERRYGSNSATYRVASMMVEHTVTYLSGESEQVIQAAYMSSQPPLPRWTKTTFNRALGVPSEAGTLLAHDPDYAPLRQQARQMAKDLDPVTYIKDALHKETLRLTTAQGILTLFGYRLPNATFQLETRVKREAKSVLQSFVAIAEYDPKAWGKYIRDDSESIESGMLFLKRLIGRSGRGEAAESMSALVLQTARETRLNTEEARRYVLVDCVTALDALLKYSKQ